MIGMNQLIGIRQATEGHASFKDLMYWTYDGEWKANGACAGHQLTLTKSSHKEQGPQPELNFLDIQRYYLSSLKHAGGPRYWSES